MAVKIIDASAVAAIVFAESKGESLTALLQHHALVAPTLLPFELTNVCLLKLLRHPTKRELLLAGYQLFHLMEIAYQEVNHFQTLTLAEQTGLTVYDAAYLWLARELQSELITLDQQLAQAAQKL